jgi:hypothetical protein
MYEIVAAKKFVYFLVIFSICNKNSSLLRKIGKRSKTEHDWFGWINLQSVLRIWTSSTWLNLLIGVRV